MKQLIVLLMLQVSILASATSGVSNSFQFENLSVSTVEQNGNEFTRISYDEPDVNTFGSIGEPCVPVKTFCISVPYNAVNIRLSYNTVKNCDINLPHPLCFNIEDLGGEIELFQGSKFPTENALISNIGYVDGIHKIVTIALCPVSVDLDNNILTFYNSVSANLTWDTDNTLANEPMKPIISYKRDKHEMVYTLPNLVNPEEVEMHTVPAVKGNKATSSNINARYVIVCPRKFAYDLERLAAYRRLKGYTTKVVAIEDILTDSKYANGDVISGINDDAGKLRAFLTDAYTNMGTRYVLLAGKYPEIPIRYGYTTSNEISIYHRVPSDLYFADLNSSWNVIQNGYYGKPSDNIDYHRELSVGRIPFENTSDIHNFIDKLKIYEHNPGLGDSNYLSKAFITRQNRNMLDNGWFKDEVFVNLKNIYNGDNLREIISNDTYPCARDVVNELNKSNYGFHSFVGHGSPYGVAVNQIGWDVYTLLGIEGQYGTSIIETQNALNNLKNKNYPAWSYSMSCANIPFDTYSDAGRTYEVSKNFGESYVLGKDYGGVLYFGHTRPAWTYEGQKLYKQLFVTISDMYEYYLGEDGPEFPVTAGDMLINLLRTSYVGHDTHLSHNLLGDPITPLWISKLNKASYIKDNSETNKFLVNYTGTQYQCLFVVQMLDMDFHTGPGLAGRNLDVDARTNLLYSCEFPNCTPVIFPLYLQKIIFNKNSYIVAGDVFCGSSVNKSEAEGNVEISESITLTIESLGNVSIQNGIIMKPYAKLHIKADGDVNISDLVLPANTSLIVEANNITIERLSKHSTAVVKLEDRNSIKKAASRSSSHEYKPLLVEGRTWWYHQRHLIYSDVIAENGVAVGEEVEIDGIKWHKINAINSRICKNSVISHNTDTRTIAYMREDGNKIYTAYFDGEVLCEGLCDYYGYIREEPWLSYQYMNVGESYKVGTEIDVQDEYNTITIDNISKLINSGIEYTLYECSIDKWPIKIIEGLGQLDALFFAPIPDYCAVLERYDIPQLRYVTDPDGTIIYEGIGGYKLWEESSVGNVTVEDDYSFRWYNLQGAEIKEPSTPGIYIRSSNSGTEKVIIR